MIDNRALSTVGVLFALGILVVGAVAPVVGVAGVAASDSPVERSADDVERTAGSADTAASTGTTATDPSRSSYPSAPQLDVATGDVAAVPLSLRNHQGATVTIEAVDGDHEIQLRYVNNDGRSKAVLYVNTFVAGNESAVRDRAYTAHGNDRVQVESRTGAGGGPLPTGEYEVTIEEDDSAGTTTKTVTVREPEIGDVTVLRAPEGAFDELDSRRNLSAAIESGVVSEPPEGDDGPEPAYGDTVVYRFNASGLFGVMDAQGRDTAEANFLAITGDDGADGPLDFEIRGMQHHSPAVLVAESIDSDTLRVVPDAQNESLYVTADLRRVATENTTVPLVGGNRVSYTVAAGSHVVDEDVTREREYSVRPREVSYEPPSQPLRRDAADDQTIEGETSLAPHTELTLTVEGIDREYETETRTTVDDDGSFEADLDLSDAPANERFTLSTTEIDDSHTLLATGNATAAAIWFDSYEADAPIESLGGSRVALVDGGFLAAYTVPPTEEITEGDLAGHSDYLEPGVHDPTVALDEEFDDSRHVVLVVHRDTDGDETFTYPDADDPYRHLSDAVYEPGRALVSGDDRTPTGQPQYLSVNLPPADGDWSEEQTTAPPATTEQTTAEPTTTEPSTDSGSTDGTTEPPLPTTRPPEETDGVTGTATGTASNGTLAPNATTAGNGTAGTTDGDGDGFGLGVALFAASLLSLAALSRRD